MTIAAIPVQSYKLIYASDAPVGIMDAVHTLEDLIWRATGERPVVGFDTDAPVTHELVIGSALRDTDAVINARNAIRDDGYALVEDNGRIYIVATAVRGIAYGIYALLEDCLGYRFYSSRFHIRRPERARAIPAGYARIENPTFMSRDVFWYDVLEPTAGETTEHIDFQAAMHVNHGAMTRFGIGEGIAYAGGFVHTLPDLAKTAHTPGIQPCLTDEATFETVRYNVRAWLDENPGARIISVSQNDSYADQGGCDCPACRAIDEREGTPMGSLLTFVNRIADDIRDDYPDVLVDTLAYRYTRKAPKTIRPASNVIIRLCSIECCFSHPLSDPSCPQNAAFVHDIEEWSSICDKLYIWDYTTDFLCYLSPFPNLAVLADNVRFFRDHHAIGLFEQGNYESLSGEFGELRAYLLSKLLWNPDITEAQLTALATEFLRDYYGPGYKSIGTYIRRTTQKAAARHLHIYDQPPAILPFDNQSDTSPTALLALWDDALTAAETPEEKLHVATSRIQALYYATYAPDEYLPAPRADLIADMHAAIADAGIVKFREGCLVSQDTTADLH